MSFLVLDKLHKIYPDGTSAVKGIDLSVDEGEFVVLLGPSGCGKTTTLRMIAGLEIATRGSIRLAGQDVTTLPPSQRDVGFVFQFYALYPHLSVRENVLFPLKSVGTPSAERDERLARVVDRLGLAPLLDRYPRQLSGGDQQRVSLARAMIRRPRVWLMDEPLGTLDADRRLEMREFIRSQQLEMKVTTIYVTHDQEEAMSLADRVVVMEGGLIQQVGTPALVYERPSTLFVANFVGSPGMNFIKGSIVVGNGGPRFEPLSGAPHEQIPAPAGAKIGHVTLGIRPEYIRAGANGPVGGRVAVNEYLGSFRSIHVDCPFGRLVVRVAPDAPVALGDQVRLTFDPAHVNYFDSATGVRL